MGQAMSVGGALSDEEAAKLFAEKDGAHPLWIERKTWLTYSELARLSVEHGAAIVLH